VHRAGQGLTVPLTVPAPALPRTSWFPFLARGGALVLAVLMLAALHRRRPTNLEVV
jgi:hypothetical protein